MPNIIDTHFSYHKKIERHYKNKEIEKCIRACKRQIKIASLVKSQWWASTNTTPPPVHRGYEILIRILEKQKDYNGARQVAKEAVEVWGNYYKENVKRLQKKAFVNDINAVIKVT